MKQLLTLVFIGLTSLYAQTVPSYVPTNGLVGWWPFNGNTNDESGNGNNGNVINATLSADRFGVLNKSYYLNGQSAYISVPVVNNNLLPQNISISVWCKIPSNYTANNGIGMLVRSRFFGYNILYDNSNQNLRFETFLNGNSTPTSSSSNGIDYSDNNWHHIVGTFNGLANKLYIDGNLISTSNSAQSNIMYASDGIVAFGRDGNNSSSSTALYQGNLDDIGIWNQALTHQEIQALFYGCSDSLQSQPQNFTAYSSTGWANFKCESSDTAAMYQWQQSNGAGWINLLNLGHYTGATSDSLVITGISNSMNNYGYRCIVIGCNTDTSDVAVLTVANGIGLGESTLDKLTISPNPTNGLVSLNALVLGTYELLTLDGRILESGKAKKDYDLTTYPKGVYHLRLSTDEGTRVLKVVKN